MSAPYYFDTINQQESHIVPGTMHARDSALSMYYRRFLALRAFAIFDFQNTPDTWDNEYLKFCLMVFGACAVLNTDKFGVIPQQCAYSGYNVFYRPTRALVTNPLFDKTYDLKIGQDCELIRLSPDWRGISELIGHYADLMAMTTVNIVTNLFNSRMSYVFAGSSKAMGETFKAMFDKIASGNPAVFIDKNLMNEDGTPNWLPFQQDLNSTYIVDKLQTAERTFLNDFYSHIGIPNIPLEKDERLNVAETTVNAYATECLVDLWKRTINATLEKVNKLFGLSVTCDYNPTLLEVIRRDDVGTADPSGDAKLQTGLV